MIWYLVSCQPGTQIDARKFDHSLAKKQPYNTKEGKGNNIRLDIDVIISEIIFQYK